MRLSPDLEMAQDFLTALDEGADGFWFATFDDLKERRDRSLARREFGSLESLAPNLNSLQARGAGVFVTVNESEGGAKSRNITRVRAVFHEQDAPGEVMFPLEPHLIVESSAGKFHRYWLVDGLLPDQFEMVMARMVKSFGSDPNAKDLSRVLRVPGFLHLKNSNRPFQVRLLHTSSAVPYTAERILNAFPPLIDEERAGNQRPRITPGGAVLEDSAGRAVAAELGARAARRSHEEPTLGRHSLVLWLGRECGQRGVSVDLADFALERFAELMRPTDAAGKRQPMNLGVERKAFLEFHAKGMIDPENKRGKNYLPRANGQRENEAKSDYSTPVDAERVPEPDSAFGDKKFPVQGLDFAVENQKRKHFEERISAAGDDYELLMALVPEIARAELIEATRARLVGKLARAVGCSAGILMEPYRVNGNGKRGRPAPEEDNFVDSINKNYALVNFGGSVRILKEGISAIFPGKRTIDLMKPADFVVWHGNQDCFFKGESMSAGAAWLRHPKRRSYSGVAFLPGTGRVEQGVYNLWRGWGITPRPGRPFDLYLQQVREVICAGDAEAYEYLIRWVAHLFQRPQELPEVAIALRSKPRTGKGSFVSHLAEIVGPEHYREIVNMDQITGNFNGHLADALLIFANESIWGGDVQRAGALKGMITDAYALNERKGVDAVGILNYKRIIAASNNDFMVHRDQYDSRWLCLDVSESRREDHAFYDALKRQMGDGGTESLAHYLMNFDISGWHPRKLPANLRQKGWDIKIEGANSFVRWYFDCLWRGWMYRPTARYAEDVADGQWPVTMLADDFRDEYERYCRAKNIGVHHQITARGIGRILDDVGVAHDREPTGKRRYLYKFGTLDEARRNFGVAWGIPDSAWPE